MPRTPLFTKKEQANNWTVACPFQTCAAIFCFTSLTLPFIHTKHVYTLQAESACAVTFTHTLTRRCAHPNNEGILKT